MISVSNGFMMYSFAQAPPASWMCLMSFSVVQKTTTGTAPPLIRRRARRNSMPFITGIFQSSSMASGICRKQAAMASWPSAASSMANSSSSRIRRATFRTTRESSTMRQDFMTSLSAIHVIGHGSSGRFRAGRDIKQARDIEHHQQRAVEPVDAGRDFTPARIEGRRIALEIRRREAEDLADGIDHQAVELAAMIDDHAHARLAGDLFLRALGQAETGADVDRGDDPAAQVKRAGDLGRRQRHAGDALRCQDVAHLEHRDAEELATDHHGDEITGFAPGARLAAARIGDGIIVVHAAPLCWLSVSESVVSSASRSNLAT